MKGEKKKCVSFDHPNLDKGSWGCCSCQTFNGFLRDECKVCGHQRCSYGEIVIENTNNIETIDTLETDLIAVTIDKKLLN